MNGDEVEDDEIEDSTFKQYERREGIIFLIEITEDILKPLDELGGQSQLEELLSSINDLLSELIITMRLTGVGIYFYNCLDSYKILKPMSPPTPNFVKLFGLNCVNMVNIKLLNDIITDNQQKVRSISSIFTPVASNDDNLPKILNTLIDDFQKQTYFNRKKLVWFTNNDRPYLKTSSKEHLWRVINDYYNFGYFIQPIFLNKVEKPFDMSLYEDIFMNTNYMPKDQPVQDQKPIDYAMKGQFKNNFKQTTLSSRIRSSIFRNKEVKRIQFACNLVLSDGKGVGGDLGCSIKGYTLYNTEKISRDFPMFSKDGTYRKVFVDSDLEKKSGGSIGLPSGDKSKSFTQIKNENHIRKGFQIGGDKVIFLNEQQLQFMSNFAFDHEAVSTFEEDDDEFDDDNDEDSGTQVAYSIPPYLKMIGIRSINTFTPYYNSEPPIFVTPDMYNGLGTTSTPGGYSNSFKTFSSLYQSLKKSEKYMVVFGCIKKNAKPSLYILYPTRIANSTKGKGWDFPEGFFLIRLPWLDDIRSLPTHFLVEENNQFDDLDEPKVTKGLVPMIQKLVLNFFYYDYNPKDYPNPNLNFFHKIAKHQLLGLELTDSDSNLLKNDITSMKKLEIKEVIESNEEISASVTEINKLIEALDQIMPKRSLPETTSDITKKRKQFVPVLEDEAVLTAWKNNEWNHFTVPQLKAYQKQYKDRIPSATKKQDIIDNITKYLDENTAR